LNNLVYNESITRITHKELLKALEIKT
jgi:hypothetical protein